MSHTEDIFFWSTSSDHIHRFVKCVFGWMTFRKLNRYSWRISISTWKLIDCSEYNQVFLNILQIYVRLIQACNFQFILNHFFVFWCSSTYLEHREKRPLFHAIAKVLLYGQVGCLFTSFIVMSLDFPFSKILMLSRLPWCIQCAWSYQLISTYWVQMIPYAP